MARHPGSCTGICGLISNRQNRDNQLSSLKCKWVARSMSLIHTLGSDATQPQTTLSECKPSSAAASYIRGVLLPQLSNQNRGLQLCLLRCSLRTC